MDPSEGPGSPPSTPELSHDGEETAEAAAAEDDLETQLRDPTLTQTRRKKLLKLLRLRDLGREKRKRKREQQKAERAAARASAEAREREAKRQLLDPEERARRVAAKAARKAAWLRECREGLRMIIDCEFSAQLTAKERNSLKQQIMHCYAANKRVDRPFRMCLYGVDDTMLAALRRIPGFDNWHVKVSPRPYLAEEPPADLVYLTADSPHEIHALDASKAYIIGGIVDRNRLKGATMAKAQAQGIAAARLPIGQYTSMSGGAVLTVNHVFQILVEHHNGHDWKEAITRTLPSRQGFSKKFTRAAGAAAERRDSADGDEDALSEAADSVAAEHAAADHSEAADSSSAALLAAPLASEVADAAVQAAAAEDPVAPRAPDAEGGATRGHAAALAARSATPEARE